MIAGDEEIGCAVATVACCTSSVYKLENITLNTVRLVPFTDTKFTQRDKTWKKENHLGFFFFFFFHLLEQQQKTEHKQTATIQVYVEMNMLY